MGNWIVSPEEMAEKDEVLTKKFQEKCYNDITKARREDEEEIQEIEATFTSGIISRGLADDEIALIKKRQKEYEEDIFGLTMGASS